MKAITLTQPWATLVAIGAKHFETRSWETDHTGLIAIHAGKGIPGNLGGERGHRARCAEEPFKAVLELAGLDPETLPRGEVVAVANLRGCFETCGYGAGLCESVGVRPAEFERSFGDYTPGRFAWALDEVVHLGEETYICRGWQQIWNLEPDIAELVEGRLAVAP